MSYPTPSRRGSRRSGRNTGRPRTNVDAEQALLGAILVNNDAYHRVADFLLPDHFMEEAHRKIFAVAGALICAGTVATPITLKTYLGDANFGGQTVIQYLARLAADATTVINAGAYGRTIHDHRRPAPAHRHRRGPGESGLRGVLDDAPTALIERTEHALLDIGAPGPDSRLDGRSAADGGAWMLDRVRGLREGTIASTAISSGLVELDRARTGASSAGSCGSWPDARAWGRRSALTTLSRCAARTCRRARLPGRGDPGAAMGPLPRRPRLPAGSSAAIRPDHGRPRPRRRGVRTDRGGAEAVGTTAPARRLPLPAFGRADRLRGEGREAASSRDSGAASASCSSIT